MCADGVIVYLLSLSVDGRETDLRRWIHAQLPVRATTSLRQGQTRQGRPVLPEQPKVLPQCQGRLPSPRDLRPGHRVGGTTRYVRPCSLVRCCHLEI